MIVLGVDPGTVRTGFGIIRKDGARLLRIASGTICTDAKAPMERRLLTIHEGLDQLLTTYGPTVAAVEDVFFAKNARSSIKLGQVRGVILLTLTRRDVAIESYAPAFIKKAIVGGGQATKSQVSHIVKAILGLKEMPQEDEGDALAIAICRANAPAIPTGRAAPSRPTRPPRPTRQK